MDNKYIHSETIIDAKGKKHKVYPTPILYIQDVARFLAKINPDFVFGSFMIPDIDEEGILKRTENGDLIYGEELLENLLDVVEIAVRHKEKREDIKQWLDIGLAKEIVETLIGLSQVKKKTQMKPENQIGID
jgi:hypothetical protein